MDYHIISDNVFFLLGLERTREYQPGNMNIVHAKELYECFRLSPGDVVSIYISDANERCRIMSLPIMAKCRVILLLKVVEPVEYAYGGGFPWLIPNIICADRLFTYLRLARTSVFKKRNVSELETLVFRYLSQGSSVLQINKLTGLSEKRIYELTRKVRQQYGLGGYHAMNILLCRDIMNLGEISEHPLNLQKITDLNAP